MSEGERPAAFFPSGAIAFFAAMASFSFDLRETAEGLAEFRRRMRLPDDWLTLRAPDPATLQRVLRALELRTITLADGVIEHPNLVAVLSPDLRLAAYVYGIDVPAADLARAVARARRGPSPLDRWMPALFVVAAAGFAASTFVFVLLLLKRRSPARTPVTG